MVSAETDFIGEFSVFSSLSYRLDADISETSINSLET
jgi:hypothetical protein